MSLPSAEGFEDDDNHLQQDERNLLASTASTAIATKVRTIIGRVHCIVAHLQRQGRTHHREHLDQLEDTSQMTSTTRDKMTYRTRQHHGHASMSQQRYKVERSCNNAQMHAHKATRRKHQCQLPTMQADCAKSKRQRNLNSKAANPDNLRNDRH